jgi:hypothetical protein
MEPGKSSSAPTSETTAAETASSAGLSDMGIATGLKILAHLLDIHPALVLGSISIMDEPVVPLLRQWADQLSPTSEMRSAAFRGIGSLSFVIGEMHNRGELTDSGKAYLTEQIDAIRTVLNG